MSSVHAGLEFKTQLTERMPYFKRGLFDQESDLKTLKGTRFYITIVVVALITNRLVIHLILRLLMRSK